ncbi:DUF4097 domain-containing protein [Clostridium tyrobutyricum]|uniref:DUF4097 domain-containing protein n=1 Tax=Clostridium tyrobutyricum TaxID=1519 RepID=UPI0011CBCDF2|nr:DUF4097 domain-containing protein [Clostridium tyrobutyricum]
MNRRLTKILIVIWVIIAITASCFLVYGIRYKGIKGFSFENRFGEANIIQKDENIAIKGYDNINIDFPSSDIFVSTTDGNNLKVVQKASTNLKDAEKFIVDRQNNSIVIRKNSNRVFNIFDFGNFNEKIELYIPKNYTKNLNIHVASGDITFNSDIKLNDIECSQSSGDFHVNNSITGSNIYIKSISGDITAEKLNSKHYDIHATSGDLDINSISGSGNVKTISGDVKINYSGINEYSNMSSTSGDINLIVPENMSFEFDGNCTSGNVNANFPLNYQNERKSRASAKVGSGPYKKINANAVSGDIKISK